MNGCDAPAGRSGTRLRPAAGCAGADGCLRYAGAGVAHSEPGRSLDHSHGALERSGGALG